MRVKFNDVFEEKGHGLVIPRRRISIGSVSMNPDVAMQLAALKVDGIRLIAGRDLEVEVRQGVTHILAQHPA